MAHPEVPFAHPEPPADSSCDQHPQLCNRFPLSPSWPREPQLCNNQADSKAATVWFSGHLTPSPTEVKPPGHCCPAFRPRSPGPRTLLSNAQDPHGPDFRVLECSLRTSEVQPFGHCCPDPNRPVTFSAGVQVPGPAQFTPASRVVQARGPGNPGSLGPVLPELNEVQVPGHCRPSCCPNPSFFPAVQSRGPL